MRTILSKVLLFCLTFICNGQVWQAYNASGKTASGAVYQAPGDIVTVNVPGLKAKTVLAFLTQSLPAPIDMTGDSFGYTVQIDVSSGAYFPDFQYNGRSYPVSIRLWFSSDPDRYNFVHVNSANQGNYWWSNPLNVDLNTLAVLGPSLMQETLSDPSRWSSALGKRGSDIPAQFFSNASAVRQIGVSIGNDNFFDLGCRVYNGTAVLHLK